MSFINIAFVGTISAGKTTLLNAIFKQNLGDTHIIKTTILPHIYTETDTDYNDANYIKSNTHNKNKLFVANQMNNFEELKYDICKLTDFVSFTKDIKLRLYDIPGLNDSETKDIYYKYLESIFTNMNIIVWTIDINSAINTSDESDICNFLLTTIKTNLTKYNINTKLIVLLNKCDDMYISEGEFILESNIQDMYNQAKRIIDTSILDIYPECKYDIVPISSENSYIYRMIQKEDITRLEDKYLNKLGYREFSRREWLGLSNEEKINTITRKLEDKTFNDELENTGFNKFTTVLQSYLNDNGECLLLLDSIKSKMINDLDTTTSIDMLSQLFRQNKQYIDKIMEDYKLDTKYREDTIKVFNNCIEFIINKYETENLEYINAETINFDNIDKYTELKKFYDTISEFVNIDNIIRTDGYPKITKLIIFSTLARIHDIKDIQEQYIHIHNLKKYGYQEWLDLLIMCITENKDIIHNPHKYIINLKHCNHIFKLTLDTILDISFTVLDKQYYNYFVNEDIPTVLSCAKLWDDIIIHSRNPYSYPIFGMRQMLNKYIGMKINNIKQFNSNYEFILETFILGLLKKHYVNEVITKNDLFP